MSIDYSKLEKRKVEEIKHSKKRRTILQGFERQIAYSEIEDLSIENLVKNKSEFDYHFSNLKYYSVTKSSETYKENWLRNNVQNGSNVLDFACGSGENGIYAAQCGGLINGIDISEEGINNAITNAKLKGVSSKCKFEVMDGEAMKFEDNTFDYGIEYGALHHVDLPKALLELARVLKPSSKMLCVEALRHNPLIHFYRKMTPHLRTEWELDHILGIESLDTMKKYFNTVEVKYFHLLSLFLVPFRKTKLFKLVYPLFDKLDNFLLSNQLIGKYGWIMIIELANPKKNELFKKIF
jgi:ubiquinone/menaquinone biosynthesis C-methylase UbiE